ncbi:MAG: DUF1698 domain-containing protein, partial [Bdellovibrionales bacterium]|nr:DUF1698 domain-containing protein [Bdellovibrionales bacterium]
MLEAIDSFKQDFDHSLFLKIHNERACELEDLALWQPSIQAVTEIRELTKRNFARSYGPVIRLGSAQDLSLEQQVVLKGAISTVMPWRKGPFELCGVEIDAEWRSDLKWERIRDCLDNPSGRIIADVGCNNGYYMFRLLEKHAPKLVL